MKYKKTVGIRNIYAKERRTPKFKKILGKNNSKEVKYAHRETGIEIDILKEAFGRMNAICRNSDDDGLKFISSKYVTYFVDRIYINSNIRSREMATLIVNQFFAPFTKSSTYYDYPDGYRHDFSQIQWPQ